MLVLVGVVGLGLAVADVGTSPLADALGSALYTAAVYLVLALVRPRAREVPLAGAALAIAVAVELTQLTPVPAALVDLWSPVRLLLGTSFDPRDLLAYLIGAVAVGALDHAAAAATAAVSANRVRPPTG